MRVMPTAIRMTVVLGLLLGTFIISNRLENTRTHRDQAQITLESIPMTFEDAESGVWSGSLSEGLGVKELDILKLDQYIKRYYRLSSGEGKAGALPVNVYVGYWQNQTGDHQGAKHSPSICLPSSGWSVEQRGKIALSLPPGSHSFNENLLNARRVVGSIMGHKQLFTYWFFSAGETYADEWKALAYLSFGALIANRTDGGIVTVSVPLSKQLPEKEAEAQAVEISDRFLKTFAGKLYEVLDGG
jgi:EpsI family protein